MTNRLLVGSRWLLRVTVISLFSLLLAVLPANGYLPETQLGAVGPGL